jgi:hypothetical protein
MVNTHSQQWKKDEAARFSGWDFSHQGSGRATGLHSENVFASV